MSFLDTFGEDWTQDAKDDDVEGVEAEVAEPVEEPEAEPEATEPTEETPEAEPEEKPTHTVPYAEMKREREKRQEAERQLRELQQPKPQVQSPRLDAYERPEEFSGHFENRLAQTQWEMRAELDGIRAEGKYGKEVVEQAIAWGQEQGSKDPTLGLRIQNSATPVDSLVQEFQQHRTLKTLGGKSFEEAAEEYAKSKGWTVSQGETPQPKPSPKAPTPSLSRRPGQGGANPAPADAFEGIFSSDKMGIK